ncbi:uncharacterized protein LOC128160530 [Crassostrea angulata]|uniref:Uncharacterized protein n=1 Tax=Magallana gigas TaxID=29159 RepID=A0A8W8NKZ1_MAGGI|nr:uncharacterized protein LOC105327727 [Crassostrea gigas]XP_052679832.1 uncharacterized protein LOC128160530 [Crassostrea angulata]|eukprot:XP_011426643.1 PREDICTED: uncharacterized protein LOC105327727 [Crassostrea gigas]
MDSFLVVSFFVALFSFSSAVPVNEQTVSFYEDWFNNYLVMADGVTCYFWQTTGQDASTLKLQSGQRALEQHMIDNLRKGVQLTQFTPNKMSVSFVIVNRCASGTSYMAAIPPSSIHIG